MTPATRRILVGLTAAFGAATLYAQLAAQTHSAPPGPAKAPKGGPNEPWPDAATIEARRVSAENRKLFASDDPLAFRLTADFKAIDADKDPNSTKVYQGTIEFAGPDGQPRTVPIEIRPRAHSRRVICSFIPLRLTFPKEGVKGTVFDGITSIKLGVHCRSDYAEIVAREYVAYRIDNLLTPRSFRARPATATYVDAKTQKSIDTRFAIFLEDDEDLARRLGGRLTSEQNLKFAQVDSDTMTMLGLFEYMISNDDVSVMAQHNIKVVEVPSGQKYPVGYDFDYAGLIDASYAIPNPLHHLTSVRDRYYMGPCRPADQLAPILATFESVKAAVMSIYDTAPVLSKSYRSEAKKFLQEFYHTIEQPNSVKHEFTTCKTVGM